MHHIVSQLNYIIERADFQVLFEKRVVRLEYELFFKKLAEEYKKRKEK